MPRGSLISAALTIARGQEPLIGFDRSTPPETGNRPGWAIPARRDRPAAELHRQPVPATRPQWPRSGRRPANQSYRRSGRTTGTPSGAGQV